MKTYNFKGTISVITKKPQSLEFIERVIKDTMFVNCTYVKQYRYNSLIYLRSFEIELENKILKFTCNKSRSEKFLALYVIEHLLKRIFLEVHAKKFGFHTKSKKKEIILGLNGDHFIMNKDHKPLFEFYQKIFTLFDENLEVFSEEEKAEVEMCKKLITKIQKQEEQALPPYKLKEEKNVGKINEGQGLGTICRSGPSAPNSN